MTRGVPGASDLHRGLITTSSDVASSDGRDLLRFRQLGSTAWIAIVIFIEWMASRLVGTVGSSSNGQRKSIKVIAGRSRSDGHDALITCIYNLNSYLISLIFMLIL